MSLPVNVRTLPLPIIDNVLVSSSKVKVPELVNVFPIVSVLEAVVPSKFNMPPEPIVVAPVTAMSLELESNVPLAPCPTAKAPDTVKLLVDTLTLAPSAMVKLFTAWLALIVFDAPLIVKVFPVFFQADVITTLPEAFIPDTAEQVNVPPVCEKSLTFRVPAIVCAPKLWL